jgi:hypothetical protein
MTALLEYQLKILKAAKRNKSIYILDYYSGYDWKKLNNPQCHEFNFNRNAYRIAKKENKDE